nr:hypothetical protein CTI12_AA617250 [Tanacetum cinerariifolium]
MRDGTPRVKDGLTLEFFLSNRHTVQSTSNHQRNVPDPLTSETFSRSFWGFDGLDVVDEQFRVYWVNGFSYDGGFCLWVGFETRPDILFAFSSLLRIDLVGQKRAMETQTSAELKKILEIMEADKRDVAQQMKLMQDHIQELILSTNQRTNGDSSSSGDSVNKEGYNSRYSNDIKVDIPKYNGKVDPDEFVEWLRTIELVSDYKQTTEDNKVKSVALKLRKYASTWWSNICLKRERLGKEK